MRHGQFQQMVVVLVSLLAALFGGSQHADAQLDRRDSGFRRALFPVDVQIDGSEGSTAVVLSLQSTEAGQSPGRIRLLVEVAKEAVLQRSTISIELDDAPVHSAFLQAAKPVLDLSVELPSVPPGFHELRIRSRLVSDLDPCAGQIDKRLWLRILAGSAVVYSQPHRNDAPQSVAGLLARWQMSRAAVRLVTEDPVPRTQIPLYLAADAFLRSLGAKPMTIGDHLPQLVVHAAQGTTVSGGEPAVAHLWVQEDSLHLSARGTKELIDLLISLRKSVRWESCVAPQCDIPNLSTDSHIASSEHLSEKRNARAALVQRIGDLGFASGYVARGEGQHTLSFAWPRPSHYEPKLWPLLRLVVHRSSHPALDAQKSSVEVRLQGHVIASFPLDSGHAVARPLVLTTQIPQAYHRLDSWLFQIVTILKGSAKPPRCVIEPSSLWLVLDAGSGLYVPRSELSYPRSLAQFADRARDASLRLLLPAAISRKLLPPLFSVLYPLGKQEPWVLARDAADCEPVCIDVQLRPPESPQDGALPGGTVTATEQNPQTRQPHLRVYLQESDHAQTSPESPDLSSIIAPRVALTPSGWQQQGDAGKSGKANQVLIPALPDIGDPVASQQQTERKLLDGLWLLLFLLLMVIGWLFVRVSRAERKPGIR